MCGHQHHASSTAGIFVLYFLLCSAAVNIRDGFLQERFFVRGKAGVLVMRAQASSTCRAKGSTPHNVGRVTRGHYKKAHCIAGAGQEAPEPGWNRCWWWWLQHRPKMKDTTVGPSVDKDGLDLKPEPLYESRAHATSVGDHSYLRAPLLTLLS